MNNSQFKLLIILHVATLFLVGMLFFQISDNKCLGNESIGAPLTNGDKNEKTEIFYQDNYIYGDKAASNELIVFTRYSCDYCKQFYNEIFQDLKDKYIQKGDLKVVFMENASLLDTNEMLMAKIAEIGREYNLYEKIQDKFHNNSFSFNYGAIVNYLSGSGLELKDIEDKLNSDVMQKRITDQLDEGNRNHITGTPIFFLNGNRLEGYTGRDNFMKFFKSFYQK